MRFLLFTLCAPFSAHGEVAVGERRMGWDRPGRSAILGLVAAALGLDRDDEAAQRGLDDGLWFAVRTDAAGQPFTDYHTTQVPGTRRDRRFATRREELAGVGLNTILSIREWRSDALYTAALWERPEADRRIADLERIKDALAQPVFILYLGRKAGALGWPTSPRIVEAPGLIEALHADPAYADRIMQEWLGPLQRRDQGQSLAFDAEATGFGAPQPDRIVIRRDQPVSRSRWQFADRRVGIIDGAEGLV